MTIEDDVLVERHGRQLWLTVNRPDKHNPLSRPVLARLAAVMAGVADDPSLACVMVRGAGERYFAAGGDLRDLDAVRTPVQVEQMALDARAALDAFRFCPVPVVAMLNGDAIGGGAELAVACDFRLMAGHARIGFIHGRLSISPAWGGGTDLAMRVGVSRALRMMSRSELVSATDALAWGLADAVVPGDQLQAAVDDFVAPMLTQAPQVLRAVTALSRAQRRGAGFDVTRAMELESIKLTWSHADHLAAVDRFLGR